MTLTILADPAPLSVDETGTVRVGRTRITLDTVIGFYKRGQSAEEIADGFPTVPLADVHAIIAYYLRHRDEVDGYLRHRAREADEIRARIEAQPGYQGRLERLRARRVALLQEPR